MEFNFLTVYAIFLGAMAIFLVYTDVNYIKAFKNALSKIDKEKYTKSSFSRNYIIMYSILSLGTIVMLFIGFEDFNYVLINFCILVVAIIEIISAQYKYCIYYNESSIFYENELLKYKNISSIKKIKSFGRNYEIKTFNGKTFYTNKAIGIKLEKLVNDYKAKK